MMRWLSCVLILLVLLGCNGQIGPMSAPMNYSFVVANNELFAVRHRDSYGTERGVLSTSDGGQTWTDFNVPPKTITLSGHDGKIFALTSNAQVFQRNDDATAWTRIWSSPGRRYTYDLTCAASGAIYVTAADGIIELSSEGAVLREYDAPSGAMCVQSFFADDQHLVVSCNPFQLAILDTAAHQLHNWNDGFSPLPDDGLHGPCKIKQHGTRFVASRSDGIYVADGLSKRWNILTDKIRHDGLNHEFCRDLNTFDSSSKWLVATGSGIHLMDGSTKVETVFTDVDDDHNLILEITPFQSRYFVSFARLNDSIGVRLGEDAKEWQTLRLNAK